MNRAPVLAALLAGATLLAAPVLTPTQAFAQDASVAKKVEALSAQGATKYRDKDYKGAAELFKKAYDLENVPNLLYNIARCYEKDGQLEEAVKFYKKFAVAPDVDSKSRKSALERIDTLNQAIAARDKANSSTANNGNNGNNGTTTTPKPAGPTEVPPNRTAAYAMIGGGVLFLAGGATMGVLASGKQSDFEAADTTPDERRDLRDSGKTFALAADGMYVVGAVLTGIGIYMAATAKPTKINPEGGSSKDAKSTIVAPWVSRTGGGLTMQFGF